MTNADIKALEKKVQRAIKKLGVAGQALAFSTSVLETALTKIGAIEAPSKRSYVKKEVTVPSKKAAAKKTVAKKAVAKKAVAKKAVAKKAPAKKAVAKRAPGRGPGMGH